MPPDNFSDNAGPERSPAEYPLSYLPHDHVESGAERSGYIQPGRLRELWFHTGTACNLACPFCLEGSKPGDNRLQRMTLADARPWMDEAAALGVSQFSFTGGEPFVVKEFIGILRYASSLNPCLVLTNGTDPVLRRLGEIEALADQPHPVSFRISIDYAGRERHDASRGRGSYDKSWRSLAALHALGFKVSLARQSDHGEDSLAVAEEFRLLLERHGLPGDTRIVSFPDFLPPGSSPGVQRITEDCMTTYHTEESRQRFMCYFSRMVIKKTGRMRVYACTLVDDDESFDLGGTLGESIGERIMLHHHRCYSCFAYGSSCSEMA